MARMRRRTKRQYAQLFDDPTLLGKGTAEVILFPNGEPEIWVRSKDGRRGMTLTMSDGPAGLGVTARRHVGTVGLTLGGNLDKDAEVYPPKGETRPDFLEVSLVQFRRDEWSQAFRAWYEGHGEHPGDRPDGEVNG